MKVILIYQTGSDKLYLHRRNRNYPSHSNLKKHEWLSKNEIQRLQFQAIIHSATTPVNINNRPYYFDEENYQKKNGYFMCSMPLQNLINQTQVYLLIRSLLVPLIAGTSAFTSESISDRSRGGFRASSIARISLHIHYHQAKWVESSVQFAQCWI